MTMSVEHKKKISEAMKKHWVERREDKRGNAENRLKASERMKAYWAKKSEEERKLQGQLLHSNEDKRITNLRASKIILKDFKDLDHAIAIKAAEQRVLMEDKPRDEVRKFSLDMEKKLKKRDGYGGWRHLPLDYLAKKLEAEMRELLISLKYESPEEVMSECVDVANFAMFIWDIMRSVPDKRTGTVRRGSKDKAHD
jgi:hypothetical protein